MSAKVHRIRCVAQALFERYSTDILLYSTAIRDGEIASVHVGPNATTYRIHKALLTQHSIYFKNALSGQWKESKEGIRLDDIDCQTCKLYVSPQKTGVNDLSQSTTSYTGFIHKSCPKHHKRGFAVRIMPKPQTSTATPITP